MTLLRIVLVNREHDVQAFEIAADFCSPGSLSEYPRSFPGTSRLVQDVLVQIFPSSNI